MREGLIVRLESTDDGSCGFGEAAPLAPFGSETLAEATDFMRRLPERLSGGELESALEAAPPAAGFGLWSAASGLRQGADQPPGAVSAILLALGTEGVDALAQARSAGARTFKVKLGCAANSVEWAALQGLVAAMLPGERLRLDPNRAWKAADAVFWKPRLEEIAERVQFIEEPFAEGLYPPQELLRLADDWPAPLALDESLSGGGLREWAQLGWPGYWVVKPSLLGRPENWTGLLACHRDRVVLSSAFETGIGLNALLRLAAGFPGTDHGLGTQAHFIDQWRAPQTGARVDPLPRETMDALWKTLSAQ